MLLETLKKNEDFQEVYKKGKSYANKYLVMYILKNELNYNRIGISVSKKVGNSVVRHRTKRLIRESFRLEKESFFEGFDIVIIARASAKGKKYQDICSALLHLGKIHKIIRNREEDVE